MLSIAIRIDSTDQLILRNFLNKHSFPSRLRISYVRDNSEHYPINQLRNRAINNTITSHFWLTDIDVWPAGMVVD